MTTPPWTWIASPQQVQALATTLENAPYMCLDTEANSAHVYREQLCLVQIQALDQFWLIDPLALGQGGLEPLRALLEDPARPKYLHGAEYDVVLCKRELGMHLRGIFDTQQAASLLGETSTGLGALVERHCAVVLAKAYSQYDWGRRPIDQAALCYAVDDVRYLPRLVEHYRAAIQAHDLEEEYALAVQAVESCEPKPRETGLGAMWRVKGASGLPRRCWQLYARIWQWREALAQARNLPPGRLLNNEALLALARQAPTSFGQLKQVARLKDWLLSEEGEHLLALMRSDQGVALELPEPPRSREVLPEEVARERRLKDWRHSESVTRGVTTQVVLPAKALEHLKRYGAHDLQAVPQLGPKRMARYGDTLRRLCSD